MNGVGGWNPPLLFEQHPKEFQCSCQKWCCSVASTGRRRATAPTSLLKNDPADHSSSFFFSSPGGVPPALVTDPLVIGSSFLPLSDALLIGWERFSFRGRREGRRGAYKFGFQSSITRTRPSVPGKTLWTIAKGHLLEAEGRRKVTTSPSLRSRVQPLVLVACWRCGSISSANRRLKDERASCTAAQRLGRLLSPSHGPSRMGTEADPARKWLGVRGVISPFPH